jgi:hypothetical protein
MHNISFSVSRDINGLTILIAKKKNQLMNKATRQKVLKRKFQI